MKNTTKQNFTLRFLLVISVALLAAITGKIQAQSKNRLPNLVLLVADDLGYGELGCQGNPEIPTPHIDSLARYGVRFTQGYVTAPYCSASRAGLLTGRYQSRFGYEFNPIGAHNEDPAAGLPTSEKTLADVLVDAGYVTGMFGKWHLGGTAKYNPIRRGFDEFFGFLHEGHYFVPPPYDGVTTWLRRRVLPGGGQGRWTSPGGKLVYSSHMGHTEPDYDADNPIYRGGQPIEEKAYFTDAITREAVSFIRRNQHNPFFLYVPYNAVHSPLQGADAYMNRFSHIPDIQRRIFAAMLANLDDSVGTILAELRTLDLEQETLIIFLSDNGGPTKELTSSNRPLRNGKGSVYEGGIRVPFLLQWKGQVPGNQTFNAPVSSLDIFRTFTATAHATLAQNQIYDGVNLIPYLRGEQQGHPHNELFWRLGQKTALRQGDWKLLRNPGRGRGAEWELYHLGNDEGETQDLAKQEPERVEAMMSRWQHWNTQMIAPVWSPRGR